VIIQAVWADVSVEEKNLTVQISTLRRVLDNGQKEPSCIQTEAGRGYRFVSTVTRLDEDAVTNTSPEPDVPRAPAFLPDNGNVQRSPSAISVLLCRRPRWQGLAGFAALLLVIVVGAALWLNLERPNPVDEAVGGRVQFVSAAEPPQAWLAQSPRLSVVVLPFQNLSGDQKDDYLADAITDDLTTDLSHIPEAFVIARESAYAYKGKATDVRQIGRELGVRYLLEGSVRRASSTLKINVQLISAETGAHLWADRFDEEISDLAVGQEQALTRMKDGLGINMVQIESARSLRERPTDPDAFDLILRARSLRHLPQSPRRDKEVLALFEQALSLEPSSISALTGIAYFLIDGRPTGVWGSFENMERAEQLLAQARAIAPDSPEVLNITLYWLRTLGRCPEVIEAAERGIRLDPNRMRMQTGVYNELAVCKTWAGHAEEDITLQEQANQLNPRSPWAFSRYRHMGFASLMLGRDQDAITFLQRSLALNPEGSDQWAYRLLAAAYARLGKFEEARRSLAEADRRWPYDTVRSHFPDNPSSSVYAKQVRGYREGLSLAGERDHADEEADFGAPPSDGGLHSEVAGPTPKNVPGAKTIRSLELASFLTESSAVVVDTVANSWGRSIPGAVGLKFAGLGGSFTDGAQDHLRRKMRELTAGDFTRPVIAVGWNSERFDGLNLALRLVALGYVDVYWYRGGREAWEVNGLSETALDVQDW
jgi:TolB-like protein